MIQRVEHNRHRIRLQVCICESLLERARGLLFRRRLDHETAFLLRPCKAVHTFGLTYPIDVLFCDSNGVVVEIVHELPPWQMVRAEDADAVWEFTTGVARKLGIRVGDRLRPC
ncbi:MAG: DUF192 domain-containing protein [Steroidobacteraceae bacterium]